MRPSTLLAALLSVALTVAPAPAAYADAKGDVASAEQAYANLDYAEANRLAAAVVRSGSGMAHDDLVRAYRLLALTHAALGKEQESKDAFVQLLTIDPDYEADPNLGPRVTSPFFEARGYWRAQGAKPGMEAQTILRSRERGLVKVTTRDPTRIVVRVTVGYRWGGDGEYRAQTIGAGDAVPVDVAAPPAGVTRFDYYAQAVDGRGNAVFEVGNPQSPKTTIVAVESSKATPARGESGSVFSSPWFWVVTGAVVVAGGAVAAAVALKPSDKVVTRDIPPTTATLSPSLLCGPSPCK